MGRYLLRRLIISIPVLFGITLVTYFIVNLAPGDPVSAMIDPEQISALGPGWLEQQKHALGLDRPLPIRYLLWLKEAAQGNLGFSYTDRQPIADKIVERVWPTLKLMLTVQVLALAIAVPIGVLSAVKQYSWIDYLATIFGFTTISIPAFFLALAAIYVFAVKLRWLPTAGMATIGQPPSLIDALKHLILPAVVLGLGQAAPLIRYTRSSMLETVRQDYVRVARAKGLTERVVVYGHALRNALIPLVTVIALNLPQLLGGTVIIEQIFAWPGMGTLAITAVRGRDYPTIMAINLIGAVAIVVSNLIADVVYAWIDPRIKYS
ncbi:MAG: peptide/nickel transport system permease protein [Thermomicrobiales bacterium]|jgi:peptide/nickel transport system permease protein|nr:peptide/nickel transport system permease protein [Thermomicrobiales bacterium]